MKFNPAIALLLSLPLLACSKTETQLYQNKQFNIRLNVPSKLHLQPKFQRGYLLSEQWRFDDGNRNRGLGDALVQITAADFKSDYFPRYFSASMRIGVSRDHTAVANCLKAGPMGKLKQTEINGIPFDVFPIQEAAMSHVVDGKSYRTVRNQTCYAVEIITAYSNYRDAKPSEKDLTSAQLSAYVEPLNKLLTQLRIK